MHIGSCNSGHYYSYCRESNQASTSDTDGPSSSSSPPRQWVELNDSEVRPFALSRMEADCYGYKFLILFSVYNSRTFVLISCVCVYVCVYAAYLSSGTLTTHDFTLMTNDMVTTTSPNPKSAYMLVYNRVKPHSTTLQLPIAPSSLEVPLPL